MKLDASMSAWGENIESVRMEEAQPAKAMGVSDPSDKRGKVPPRSNSENRLSSTSGFGADVGKGSLKTPSYIEIRMQN